MNSPFPRSRLLIACLGAVLPISDLALARSPWTPPAQTPSSENRSSETQSPTKLTAGESIELTLGPKRQAKLSFTQPQHQLIRVLVTSLDQAARPSLSAKVGKSPRKAETYRFAGDSVLEWPATRKGMVELTIKGKQASDRYRVKLLTSAIPTLGAGATKLTFSFGCPIAPTAWHRANLKAKTKQMLIVPEERAAESGTRRIETTVFDEKARKALFSGRGGNASWTSRRAQCALIRIQRPERVAGKLSANLYEVRGNLRPLAIAPAPELLDISEELPEQGWPLEFEVDVAQGEAAPFELVVGEENADKAVILETTGGSLEDPTLGVHETDGVKLLAWDDDSGNGKHARLQVKVDGDGILQGFVQGLTGKLGGSVKIRCRPR